MQYIIRDQPSVNLIGFLAVRERLSFPFPINLLCTGLLRSDTIPLGVECHEPLGSALILFSLVPFLFPSSICLYYCVGMCRDD